MVHSTVMVNTAEMRAMGEGGCLFDEISNLVEPTERRHTEVPAGLISQG
jgi:hypothetical protein